VLCELLSLPDGIHDLLLTCSLPKDQDCHELWSKRRKKVLRDPGVEKKSDSLAEAAVSQSGSGNQWSPESETSNTKHSDVLSPTTTSQRRQLSIILNCSSCHKQYTQPRKINIQIHTGSSIDYVATFLLIATAVLRYLDCR